MNLVTQTFGLLRPKGSGSYPPPRGLLMTTLWFHLSRHKRAPDRDQQHPKKKKEYNAFFSVIFL